MFVCLFVAHFFFYFDWHLYFYTVSFSISACLRLLFTHLLYFSNQLQLVSLFPILPLFFFLRSVTYLQHSCVMNNGGETVTIIVFISKTNFDLCFSMTAFLCKPFSQVSPYLCLFFTYECFIGQLWHRCETIVINKVTG